MKGTKTEENLRSAISGETQAAVLYELFSAKAKKDGFEEIAEIFKTTAKNEMAHAEIYFKLLQCIGKTVENLEHSEKSEHHENSVMYPEFAAQARKDGLDEIANTFEMVGKIEEEHEKTFRYFKNQIQNNSLFSKGIQTQWVCRNCGHHLSSPDAPEICPVCKHPKAFFEEKKNAY